MKRKSKKMTGWTLSWIRMMLWWFIENAGQWIIHHRSNPAVVRYARQCTAYPISSWLYDEDRFYCMTADRKCEKAVIREFLPLSSN